MALAHFVYRSRPDRYQNQILAVQLVCEALAVGLIGGATWVLTDERLIRLLGLASMFIVWPKLWTYYSFLSTLDTPLAEPLRRSGRLNWLFALTLLAGASVLVRPDWYGGAVHYWPEVRALNMAPGTAFIPIFWLWAAMWIVGLSFSISALRSARTAIGKEQAKAYLIAFGFRDVGFLASALAFTFIPPTYRYFHWIYAAFPSIWLAYYPLVAWGILRHQLFDIELRVKRGFERSVVATVIAGGFFVLTYTLEQFMNVNNFVVGLVIAVIVTALFQRLHRMAEQLANRLMPGVDTSESYLTDRRQEVYRSAVEAALLDGAVSERERAILGQLQESLGVGRTEGERIERDAQLAFHSAAGSAVPAS